MDPLICQLSAAAQQQRGKERNDGRNVVVGTQSTGYMTDGRVFELQVDQGCPTTKHNHAAVVWSRSC